MRMLPEDIYRVEEQEFRYGEEAEAPVPIHRRGAALGRRRRPPTTATVEGDPETAGSKLAQGRFVFGIFVLRDSCACWLMTHDD